jgi:hypothetical protein
MLGAVAAVVTAPPWVAAALAVAGWVVPGKEEGALVVQLLVEQG